MSNRTPPGMVSQWCRGERQKAGSSPKHFHALLNLLLADCSPLRTLTYSYSHSKSTQKAAKSKWSSGIKAKNVAKPGRPSCDIWDSLNAKRELCQMEVTLSFSPRRTNYKSGYSTESEFGSLLHPRDVPARPWLDKHVIVMPTSQKCASVRACCQISTFFFF